jgi:ubiquinone/menaquinone biosynthesis C-methylase UbiE
MTSAASVHHPIFARMYERMAASFESKGAAEHRERLLAGLAGRVIELGAGTGLNFTHYPTTVTEVIAIEPEARLRTVAHTAAEAAPIPVTVIDGTADHLPADDRSFDAGVASLVLCSVPDQAKALTELARVIRPGGELRFYEHVVADNHRWAARQHRAAPIWRRLGGGCHPDRDTAVAIAGAGFHVNSCESFLFAPTWIAKLTASHILGRATRP